MGFYDFKGYWRNEGEGFYDGKGYFRSSGDDFYDGKGYFRSPGDGFYDAKGNWVNPGGAFYDGKGYVRTANPPSAVSPDGEGGIAGLLLLLPIAFLWMMTTFMIEWIVAHLYAVFMGYVILDAIICLLITKNKKHRGAKFVFSFIGNYLCILSFIYIMLLYAVPYMVMNGADFWSFVEFSLILVFGVGGIILLQFFNYYHENAILEFIAGTAFFITAIILIKNHVSEMGIIENFIEIYNLEHRILFNVLFGFVIPN